MTASASKSCKSLTAKLKLKNEESESREEGYRTDRCDASQVEERPSRDNDQRVSSGSRHPKHDRELADSVGNTLPPLILSEEFSSTKEVGRVNSKSSNGYPQTSEQEKAQQGSEADAPTGLRPLALSLLIVGISLSVFLVSLDRTIITTVRTR